MGNYDRLNELKAKHAQEVKELQNRIDKLLEEKKELKEALKQLKTERYLDKRGQGEVDKLNAELKKANARIKQLEDRERSKESFTCFSKQRQKLIADINRLKSDSPNIESLIYKFKMGMSEALIIAKKAKKKELLIRDCYIHVFRDDLMALLEKTLQVLINKKHLHLYKILRSLEEKPSFLDKQYRDDLEFLNNKETYSNMLSIVYLENTAFHGTTSSRKAIAPGSEEDDTGITSFFDLDSESQVTAIFSILELLYYVFTSKKTEQILFMINSQWK